MLTVENLFVKFGKSVILHDVSLNIQKGEMVGIIGPNGCGKTTFLNAISGFAPVNAGSILYNDVDVTKWPAFKRAKAGIGRSFQSAGVFREMTLEENLMIAVEHAHNYPWWWKFSARHRSIADRMIDEALGEVGLHAHKNSLAGVLSGGQLRLLELARLKLSGGDLMLIDEPTAGVSPAMRKILAETITKLAKEGNRSIMIVEHDMKFLFNLVDRVIVFVEGQKYLEGKPEEVQKDKRLQEVYFGS